MDKPVKREWVKNAAIIFLLVLLILTFFSNTIMNRSLPEVATAYADTGTITAQVRGTGKVQSEGEYTVKADSTREIRSVLVRSGQQVNAGDMLFVLGSGDSEELTAAQETLSQLQLSYQRSALSMEAYDYTKEEKELAAAKEDLKNAKDALAEAEDELNNSLDNIDPVKSAEITKKKAELDNAEELLTQLTAEREDKITEAQNQVSVALQDYNTVKARYDAAMDGMNPDEDIEALTLELEAAETALTQAKQEYADLSTTEDTAIASLQEKITKLQGEYDALLASNKVDTTENQKAVQEAQEALDNAQDVYDNLKYNLDKQKAADKKTAALAALDLADIARQIEKQKKVVSELSGGDENTITANVSGTISSISITAGDTPSKGDTLCVIEVPDLGYSMTFTCTADQAKRLHVGDTATVSNYYWGNEITATLTGIANDPKDPQGSRILSFDLEGDVTSGADLTISVGSRSANYDVVIPNSAIRSDSNGSFVLVVTAKSSPLGNRYYASREAIEVLAADDENSAVTGGLSAGDYVITTSNKPITAGEQVRMAD